MSRGGRKENRARQLEAGRPLYCRMNAVDTCTRSGSWLGAGWELMSHVR